VQADRLTTLRLSHAILHRDALRELRRFANVEHLSILQCRSLHGVVTVADAAAVVGRDCWPRLRSCQLEFDDLDDGWDGVDDGRFGVGCLP